MEDPKPIGQLLPTNINPKEPEVIDYEDDQAVNEYLSIEFPGIKCTPQEIFKGKCHALTLATNRIAAEEEKRKKEERIAFATRPWNADQMAKQAITTGKAMGIQWGFDFTIDNDNKHVFNLLCLYFTNDKQFETFGMNGMNYSLDKGIWLQSNDRGSGKSVLLRSFWMNKRSCFGYKNTTELAVMFQKGGYDAIDPYLQPMPQGANALNFYQKESGFMYDELFFEDKVNYMGSPVNVSSYIISKLYDFSNSQRHKRFKFHCTSNFDGEDIENIAGKSFRSRMPEMFNLIKLNGPDRRKK